MRIPPQNLEAEQSLLGSLLIDKDAIMRVGDIVRVEDFYRQAHADIYEAIMDLTTRREPVDLLSLGNRLTEKGKLESIGGRAYLMELTTTVPTAAHVANYAQIVRKKATLRGLLAAATDITRIGFENDDEELDAILESAEKSLFKVSQAGMSANFVHIKDTLNSAFERIDELSREKGKLRGIPTGYTDLDNLTSGLQRSDLIILAARPSVGKTAFALDIARQAAVKHKASVGIFSLEMSKDQLVDRMLSSESGVDLGKIRRGQLSDTGDQMSDFARIGHALGVLSEAKIFIDDTASLNITAVRTKARRLQMDHGLDLLIVDYLQLMESRSGSKNSDNRVQEVSEISRGLKTLARELNVPVIALSQLSRGAENIKPAIPRLSHLRESGAIEQDADIVMFIYRKARDSNYRPEELTMEEKHLAEIHIAKHRNGPVGEVKLFYDEAHVSFKNLANRPQTQFTPMQAASGSNAMPRSPAMAAAGATPVGATPVGATPVAPGPKAADGGPAF
ncbi:MAG: replicative helicase, replicative helicase [Candidatus Parcubacteria bacterium]|jgi:replicative DNA helicase